MPAASPTLGFWVALANDDGSRGPAVELYPAPTRTDYPKAPAADVVETADGRVVLQHPTQDGRRRSWIWANFGPDAVRYERQFAWLDGLRSHVRMTDGYSPFVYVYDGTTGLLNERRVLEVTPALGSTSSVLQVPDLSATVHPDALVHAAVDVLGPGGPEQRVSVRYATTTSLAIEPTLTDPIGTRTLRLTWLEPRWWRARVIDTTRVLRDEGGNVRYTESRFTFVIQDAAWTELG